MPFKSVKLVVVAIGVICLMILLTVNLLKDEKTRFHDEFLYGNVRFLKETPYKVELKNHTIRKVELRSYGNESDVTENHFNRKGNLVETSVMPTPNKSTLNYSLKYSYTSDNRLLRKDYFSNKGEWYASNSCHYDSLGRLIESDFGDSQRRYTYEKEEEVRIVDAHNSKDEIEFQYTEYFQGDFIVLSDIYCLDAKWHLWEQFERDEMGNPTKFRMGNSRADLKKTRWQTFEYEYDFNGNWIKQTRFVFGKPTYVTERIIHYY